MFNKILVPIDIDYPKTSKAVYDNAALLASLSDAQIRIVSVMPGFFHAHCGIFCHRGDKKRGKESI